MPTSSMTKASAQMRTSHLLRGDWPHHTAYGNAPFEELNFKCLPACSFLHDEIPFSHVRAEMKLYEWVHICPGMSLTGWETFGASLTSDPQLYLKEKKKMKNLG